MDDTKGFYLLRSYYEAAKRIPDKEVRADYFMAICSYAFDDIIPEIDGYAAMAFELVKPNIDANKKRSGRPKKEEVKESDLKVTCKSLKSNSEVTQKSLHPIGVMSNDIRSNDKGDMIPPKSPKGFDSFWEAYPQKVGKEAAKKAFQKVKVPLETLLQAIEAQKCSVQWNRESGKYIPNPATWLNQGRWEDEVEQQVNRSVTVDTSSLLAMLEKV